MNFKLCFSVFVLFLALSAHRVTSEETSENGAQHSNEEFYTVLYNISSCCGIFKDFSLMDMKNWVEDIRAWKPPQELQEKFPYYFAGYDVEGRPVWFFEMGKYNFRAQIRKGQEGSDDLEKYLYQGAIIALETSAVKNVTEAVHVTQGTIIMDMDKFDLAQFTHAPTFSFLSKIFRTYAYLLDVVVKRAIIVNAAFPPEVITKYSAGIFGPLVPKFNVYGRSKSKWMPVLKQLIPEKSLPPIYGGSKDFKPLKVYG